MCIFFNILGTATAHVSKPHIGGVDGETSCEPGGEELLDYWHTSLGKFRFTIEDLPQYLQYIYQLLNVILNYIFVVMINNIKIFFRNYQNLKILTYYTICYK